MLYSDTNINQNCKMKYDNTANIKYQAELAKYRKNFKPTKSFKPNKPAFMKLLRSYKAAWIHDESEIIVGMLKGEREPSRNRQLMEYGVSKGWVEVKDAEGGKYDNFHFTATGLQDIREVLAQTTCISGRTCK